MVLGSADVIWVLLNAAVGTQQLRQSEKEAPSLPSREMTVNDEVPGGTRAGQPGTAVKPQRGAPRGGVCHAEHRGDWCGPALGRLQS